MIGEAHDVRSWAELMQASSGKASVPSQDSAADRLVSTRALLSMDKAVSVLHISEEAGRPEPRPVLLSQLEMFNAS